MDFVPSCLQFLVAGEIGCAARQMSCLARVAKLPVQGVGPGTCTCILPLVSNCCAHPKRCWPVQDSTSLLRAMSGLPQACDEPEEDGSDAEAVAASQLLASLAARGAAVERPVPDFDAHGVAVALHMFPGLMTAGLAPALSWQVANGQRHQ